MLASVNKCFISQTLCVTPLYPKILKKNLAMSLIPLDRGVGEMDESSTRTGEGVRRYAIFRSRHPSFTAHHGPRRARTSVLHAKIADEGASPARGMPNKRLGAS